MLAGDAVLYVAAIAITQRQGAPWVGDAMFWAGVAHHSRLVNAAGDPVTHRPCEAVLLRPAPSVEATMPKVGRFVTDPRAGAYCQVTLDSGEKIIVNHDKGGFGGGMLTIEVSKFMGFASDRLFACDLDSSHGKSVLEWLTRGAEPGTIAATPLGAAVAIVKDAGTLPDLKERCQTLMSKG
jgi:hypothetical protein